uniref:Putative transport n=1 Tax=Ixodes ricinus TaxID=34613 RepID=V5I491_IXORI
MAKLIRWENLLTYDTLVHAVAGAAGSAVAMTVFFPLDTVRSRLQVEERREPKGTLVLLRELVADEGPGSVYRGLGPVLTSLWCSNFVYFYSFHGLRSVTAAGGHSALSDLFLASVAGVVNVLATTPLWVVNTRIKMQGAKVLAGDGLRRHPRYEGLWHGLRHIARTEGLGALWASTLPSLVLVSSPAVQFMVYEALKRRAADAQLPLSGAVVFAIGALSKVISTVATYPLQLVQAKLRYGCPEASKGLAGLLLHIARTQGPAGLYRGLEAKLWQTVLTAALMFVAYEKIVRFVMRLLKPSVRAAY